ncbi:hybrid sensor histidine kinase/response regulator [Roseiconus lacunae]|uniref:hybrid sensor histidine kinase/response regulator n=1 Tax=Roseiconus lacunae TaxID=2605694 RepID=UPI0011F0C8C3|nr:response regulator [Roseiconus lacunae]
MDQSQTLPEVKRPLQKQLLRSHLSIATFGLIGLLIILMLQLNLRQRTFDLTNERAPAAQASMQIVAGVQESLAALRGWIVAGNPQFKGERLSAWNDSISPSIKALHEIQAQSGQTDSDETLRRVEKQLQSLRETQWWIEDVAHTPGNEPYTLFYAEHVLPISHSIFESTSQLVDLENQRDSGARVAILGPLVNFRGSFVRCKDILQQFSDQEGMIDQDRHRRQLKVCQRQLQSLKKLHDRFEPEQQELVKIVDAEFTAYQSVATELIDPERPRPWNVARHRLNSEAIPIATEVTNILKQISEHHLTTMNAESETVTNLSNLVAIISVITTILLTLASATSANWIASRLASPIVELTEAASRVGQGNLDTPVPVESDDELGLLAYQFNVMRIQLANESRALERAKGILQRKERLLQEIFSSAAVAMLMVDQNGRIALTNQQSELLFGYPAGGLLGNSILNLLPEEFCESNFFVQTDNSIDGVRDFCPIKQELFAQGRNGYQIPVEVGLTPIQTGSERYHLCVIVNLTERRRQERLLIESREAALQASRAKSDFLANMSHEIRTPMNAIIGLTHLVLDTSLDELQRDYLDTVSDSAEALLKVINDILDFSRIEAGKLELDRYDFALPDLVGDTLKTFAVKADEKKLELTCRIASNVPEVVIGDAGRTRQILLNLIGNAIKFTATGHVLVEVTIDDADLVPSSHVKVQFSVTDTGVGIPHEHLQRIFENFEQVDTSTTRQFGGTGLGLSIASRLANAMAGNISVESDVNRGSTFRFSAIFERSESTSIPPWRLLISKLKSTRVLIVDDHEMNLIILREMLETHGVEVDTACSAFDGLKKLRDSVDADFDYEIILSDLNMPQLDGYQFATAVAQENQYYSRLPLILLTSSGFTDNDTDLEQCNIAGRLTKPIKQSELYELIVRTLDIRDDSDSEESTELGKNGLETDVSISPIDRDPASHLRPLKILLAEDSLPNRKLAMAILDASGHRVDVAMNGLQAVQAVQLQTYDVVLMDVQMPEMDGFEATAAIRELDELRNYHTPIVALTAHALTGDRERCLNAGMDNYVSKPVNPIQLFRAIGEAIGLDSQSSTNPRSDIEHSTSSITSSRPSQTSLMDDFKPSGVPEIPWPELLDHVGGQTERLCEITKAYALEIKLVSEGLSFSLTTNDADETSRYAHKLKNAIRFFQQSDTLKFVQVLEKAPAEVNLRAAQDAYDQLAPRIETLLTAVEDHLRSLELPHEL